MPIKQIVRNWVQCDICGKSHFDPAVSITEQLRIERFAGWTGNKDLIFCPECSRRWAEFEKKGRR